MGVADQPADRAIDERTVKLTATGLEPAAVIAVARHDAPIQMGADAFAAMDRSAAVVQALVDSEEPVVRDLDRVRIARGRADPGRAPRRAAAGADPLSRRGDGSAGRARGRPGDDVPAGAHARDGLLGREAGRRRGDRRDAERGTYARRPRARLARRQRRSGTARTLRAGADRRRRGLRRRRGSPARIRGARGRATSPARALGQGRARADQRHRRDARDARARLRGSAFAVARRRHRRRDVGRGAPRHGPGVRGGPDRASPATRSGDERREPPGAAGGLGDRCEPPLRRPTRSGRLLAAVRAAGDGRGARHARARRAASPRPSFAPRSTTRWC